MTLVGKEGLVRLEKKKLLPNICLEVPDSRIQGVDADTCVNYAEDIPVLVAEVTDGVVVLESEMPVT